MRIEKIVGKKYKEKPANCIIDSHSFLIKGAYIKQMSSGIYSFYAPTVKIMDRIKKIIKEEMDDLGGQEVLLPVIMPGELWDESDRLNNIGNELVKFQDRNSNQLVLAMTHEEAAVHLVRDCSSSYAKYPFMIYQFQTKFRDEKRPRAGLIRTREFLMKDAYSFHTSKSDLDMYYQKVVKSYNNIFCKIGLEKVIVVESDSGMMGGNISHEFMMLTPIGEDSIALCTNCRYKANIETAKVVHTKEKDEKMLPLKKLYIPFAKSIKDVLHHCGSDLNKYFKCSLFKTKKSGKTIAVFHRGDIEINEAKIKNIVQEGIYQYSCEIKNNYKIGLDKEDLNILKLYDNSLEMEKNLICEAEEDNYYYVGFNIERDYGTVIYHDLSKIKENYICPKCGNRSIIVKKGIEIANTFQLGNKYTKSMNMKFIDEKSNSLYPVMGCYGIGIGRLIASICEMHHDESGPIWPITVAPWEVHICCLRSDIIECKTIAENLYNSLKCNGVDVLLDTRMIRAGEMFAEADLMGIPIRIIVSPKNIEKKIIEIQTRDRQIKRKISLGEEMNYILDLRNEMINNYYDKIK